MQEKRTTFRKKGQRTAQALTENNRSGQRTQVMVMVMVVNSALVRTHQSTYSGSFGPVLPPGWLSYTRSVAVPLDVEGLTRPPLAAQCPLRRPGVGVVLLSHCWLWGRGGLGTRCMHRPRAAYPGSLRGVAAPLTSLLCPCATRHTLTGPILIPCSVVPPPRSSSSTYRILTPAFFLGPLRFVTSAYPPALLTPRLARPSYPGFTAGL